MGPLELQVTAALRAFGLSVSLSVGRDVVALVGPSGAGKSTVLRAIAGLFSPQGGRIACGDDVWFDAAAGIDLPPERRSVGMVFQEYALFPHMTVAQNVGFGGPDRIAELLARMSIEHLADAPVTRVSGGERQRVALARALARDPKVLLLDEPLSALDPHTRAGVRAHLRELLGELRLPTLLVTHDFDDAAALADEIAVIVDGEIRQRGTPFELTAAPADAFVASFTGAEVLDVIVDDGHAVLPTGQRLPARGAAPGRATLAVYPWEVVVGADGVAATVVGASPLGAGVRVHTDALSFDLPSGPAPPPGARVGLVLSQPLRLFPPA